MKNVLKWIGIVVGVVVALIVVAVSGLYINAQLQFNKTYDKQVEAVAIPTDAGSIANGRHIAQTRCIGCHGADLSGGQFFEDPAIGYVDAANLTAGKGGKGSTYSDADFVRAIRYGVRSDGTSVFIMASQAFYYFSDKDLGSLIAYLRTVPPVDKEPRPRTFTFMANLLYGAGLFGDLLPADNIDHAHRPPAPEPGITIEYGDYQVRTNDCRACHGEQLAGGKSSDPSAKVAPNLTPGGELNGWTEEQFLNTLRTGVTPEGRQLDGTQMPLKEVGALTDDELKAIFKYLGSLPKLVTVTP